LFASAIKVIGARSAIARRLLGLLPAAHPREQDHRCRADDR
jgi:hypothetical protein